MFDFRKIHIVGFCSITRTVFFWNSYIILNTHGEKIEENTDKVGLTISREICEVENLFIVQTSGMDRQVL